MFPPGATLKHPFRVYNLDVRITSSSLDFGSFSIRVGNDMGCPPIDTGSDLCTEARDPQCKV